MTDTETAVFIRFNSLDEKARKGLEQSAQTHVFAKGTEVFGKGDEDCRLFWVIKGKAEIMNIGLSGRKVTVNIVSEGDIFGEISALDGLPRTAHAFALEKSTLGIVSRSALLGLIKSNSELAAAMIQILCNRARWMSRYLDDQIFADLEERLARRLLMLNERFGAPTIGLNISQSDLADFVGVTREATNKTLSTWRDMGLIELARNHIRILKAQELKKSAGLGAEQTG